MTTSPSPHLRVVVVGGGFGGLTLVRALRGRAVDVTLVDRRNFHLFQPLLYQVATGGLSPANIATPLRALVKRQRNVRVLLGEATGVDVAGRRLLLDEGVVPYDLLVLATGVRHSYFGRPDWEVRAPGLKTLEDATGIRARILGAFEAAEREEDEARRLEWLTFVVVGAGPTGVELAGALAEIARHTLRDEFRRIDPAAARILLVEGADRVLGAYDPSLSARAAADLARLGIDVRTRTLVTDVREDGVTLRHGDAAEAVRARTVLWAAGVEGSPLGRALAEASGAATDRAGHVAVEPDLTLRGHPELFVVGDLALFEHQTGKPLPGVAPVAMQQGKYVARAIEARLAGREVAPFRYVDKGSMATIGRASAVAELAGLRFGGYLAWLTWLFVHLLYIVQFGNRVLVFVQWAWSYLTWARSARLITAPAAVPTSPPPAGTSPPGQRTFPSG
jgi:NADH dehydrogenase